MAVNKKLPEWVQDVCDMIEARIFDSHINFTCPICGVENDEHTDCGCYADIHYGKD